MTHNHKLYIIMHNDVFDMNPGKGMAQAAHAQAEFDHIMFFYDDPDMSYFYGEWKGDRCFGTTIVLEASTDVAHSIVMKFKTKTKFPSGIITDPTYPYRNYYGDVKTASIATCSWAFVPSPSFEYVTKGSDSSYIDAENYIEDLIKALPLHR